MLLHAPLRVHSCWFADIRNWIRNIEQHASENVNKILVGNKADMDESKRVSGAGAQGVPRVSV